MLFFVRTKRFVPLITLTFFVSFFGMVLGATPGSSASAHPSPLVHRDAPLTNTSAGPGTQVDRVDMVTSTFGYGVAANNTFYPTQGVFLVRTTDAGSSWTMQSALPYLSFHQSGGEIVPTIDFVSRLVGYLGSGQTVPGSLFVTTDGGVVWSKISTPGVMPTFLATASTLAVVSDMCVHPHQDSNFNLCPNDLSLYRVGATTPWRSVTIPRTSNVANRNAELFAVISPSTFIVSEGDPGGGGEHSRLSLSETIDAGVTWQHLDDPCAGLGSDQLVTFNSRTWLLSCFLGEGMNQGISNLWRTTSAGASWTRVLHGNGEATTLVSSGNRRILFGEVGGATGGVVYSTDGGAKWSRTDIDGQGGAPESLSIIGPDGALDDVIGGLIYRTANGRRWTALPELIAGKYKGLSICTARDGVSAALSPKPVKNIPGSSPIIFTNGGARSCYLDASPIVQTTVGNARRPVGPPAETNSSPKADFVVLKAHGGQANVMVLITPTTGWTPPPVCAAKIAKGLTINFGSPSHFYDQFRVPTLVCTQLASVSVNEVLTGTNTHT
jgi:photosystem II stability/assembly factor-like uncharacterized protein